MSVPRVRDPDQLWALRAMKAAGDRPLTMSEIKATAKGMRVANGEVAPPQLRVTDHVMDDLSIDGLIEKWVDGRRVHVLAYAGTASKSSAYSITPLGLAALEAADGRPSARVTTAQIEDFLRHGKHYAAAQLRVQGIARTWSEAWAMVDNHGKRGNARK